MASTDAWWSRKLRTYVRGVGRKIVSHTKDFFKIQKILITKAKSKVKKLFKKGKKIAKKAGKKVVMVRGRFMAFVRSYGLIVYGGTTPQ